jgi:biopolymer transport protein TolQ
MTCSPLPIANLYDAYVTSSFFSGKLIVLILIAASVMAWSVMLTKFKDLQQAAAASRRFTERFRRAAHPLELFSGVRESAPCPLAAVYESACAAVCTEVGVAEGPAPTLFPAAPRAGSGILLTSLQIEAVRHAAERSVADEILRLENRMGFLMTAVSASPLLGLLGTVWGVLDAFGAMATKGMANLSVVAPGISAALLTTVIGLLVALPSSIGYNLLAGRIREMAVQMDNFAQELVSALQRHCVPPA